MKVDGKHTRTIWLEPDGWSVGVIDQTKLPHRFATIRLTTLDEAAHAIASMQVRGAPLIGAAAAYGVCLALRADASDEALERAYAMLLATRPTAINLKWALDEMVAAVRNLGMPLYGCQPPTGYSDKAEAWVNSGALLNRMNFAVSLTGSRRERSAGDGIRPLQGRTGGRPAVTSGALVAGERARQAVVRHPAR